MKKTLILFAAAFAAAIASAAGVQVLGPGANVLVGGPGRVLAAEAFSPSATGTVTLSRVLDSWTYGTETYAVTNGWTNTVAWASETVTNRVVREVADYVSVTNAVYTNVVAGVTNVAYSTSRLANGSHLVTNDVVTVRPAWTETRHPLTGTATRDAVSHTVVTNQIGTISLSSHVGTLAPTNLYFTAGDVYIVGGSATVRLYFEAD